MSPHEVSFWCLMTNGIKSLTLWWLISPMKWMACVSDFTMDYFSWPNSWNKHKTADFVPVLRYIPHFAGFWPAFCGWCHISARIGRKGNRTVTYGAAFE
jgi:hypothetical protein